jgi:LacI family gluconate utilization system Gnt-I transcriptional repressor
LSIVGFNDLDFSAIAYPALTTVATPRYEIGKRSGEIVLEIIRGSGKRPRDRQIDLGYRLIERQSAGAPTTGLKGAHGHLDEG